MSVPSAQWVACRIAAWGKRRTKLNIVCSCLDLEKSLGLEACPRFPSVHALFTNYIQFAFPASSSWYQVPRGRCSVAASAEADYNERKLHKMIACADLTHKGGNYPALFITSWFFGLNLKATNRACLFTWHRSVFSIQEADWGLIAACGSRGRKKREGSFFFTWWLFQAPSRLMVWEIYEGGVFIPPPPGVKQTSVSTRQSGTSEGDTTTDSLPVYH